MEYRTQSIDTTWIKWLGGVALGAVAMYISDPSVGRQRRALLKDKIAYYRSRTQKLIDSRIRDARNRLAGLLAEANRFLAVRKQEISHQHAVETGAEPLPDSALPTSAKAAGWLAGAVAVGLLTWWATSRQS